jgi:hypothetical protein
MPPNKGPPNILKPSFMLRSHIVSWQYVPKKSLNILSLVGTKIKPINLDIHLLTKNDFFRINLHALITFFEPFKILIKNHKVDVSTKLTITLQPTNGRQTKLYFLSLLWIFPIRKMSTSLTFVFNQRGFPKV